MDDGRDGVKAATIANIRQVLILLMIVCLAALVVFHPFRLWVGIALILMALAYVVLDQVADVMKRQGWDSMLGGAKQRAHAPEQEAEPDYWRSTPTRLADVERRMKALREAFYHTDANWLRTRAARKELRAVSEACRPYYERMMLAERAVYTMLNTTQISGVKPKAIMKQVQQLSKQIAVLVEQIQLADRLLTVYDAGADEAIMVRQARERLIRRADRAMQVLEGVPARLLQLATATSTRGLTRLRDELRDMSTHLEGKAEAYETMNEPFSYLETERARLSKKE